VSESGNHLISEKGCCLKCKLQLIYIFQKSFTKEEVHWQNFWWNKGNCLYFPSSNTKSYSYSNTA